MVGITLLAVCMKEAILPAADTQRNSLSVLDHLKSLTKTFIIFIISKIEKSKIMLDLQNILRAMVKRSINERLALARIVLIFDLYSFKLKLYSLVAELCSRNNCLKFNKLCLFKFIEFIFTCNIV